MAQGQPKGKGLGPGDFPHGYSRAGTKAGAGAAGRQLEHGWATRHGEGGICVVRGIDNFKPSRAHPREKNGDRAENERNLRGKKALLASLRPTHPSVAASFTCCVAFSADHKGFSPLGKQARLRGQAPWKSYR